MVRFWRKVQFQRHLRWLRSQGEVSLDEWPAYRDRLIESVRLAVLLDFRLSSQCYGLMTNMVSLARKLPLSEERRADLVVHIRGHWPASVHEMFSRLLDYAHVGY